MTDLDAALDGLPITPASLTGAAGKPKAHRHEWVLTEHTTPDYTVILEHHCRRCGVIRDQTRSRRGKQSRNYGNRAELQAARKYGGEKIGQAGGPVDIRGADFNTQVKTHRRLPPLEWRKVFGAMAEKGERCPRLLLRFVQGPGLPPVDYFVFDASDFLDWFGKDG